MATWIWWRGDGGGGGGVTDHGALTGLADDDHTQYLLATGLREWSEQAGDPATPASTKWALYFKSGGLYYVDDLGTVTGPLTTGGGDMVLADVQTVTGAKTFNASTFKIAGATSGDTTVNATAVASGVLTLPAATDTLVGRDTTDTLTNKTLTTPTVGDFSNATHDHTNAAGGGTLSLPASTITSGALAHERGGLEADVSAYDGLVRIAAGATSNLKSNFAGTTAPIATDDSGAGYAVGSRWIDTTNDKEYVCLDATATAAVWTETTSQPTGDVVGPGSATDNAVVRYDGTTGKLVQDSGVTINDDNRLVIPYAVDYYSSDNRGLHFGGNTSTYPRLQANSTTKLQLFLNGSQQVEFGTASSTTGAIAANGGSGVRHALTQGSSSGSATQDIGLARTGANTWAITNSSSGAGYLEFRDGTLATPTSPSTIKIGAESGDLKARVSGGVNTQLTNVKRTITFDVSRAKLPASNPAVLDRSGDQDMLLFDDTTSESASWQFIMPQTYGSSLTARLIFSVATTQTGAKNVGWRAYLDAMTPSSDSEDVGTRSYATANTGTHALASGQVAGYPRVQTITMTNADSVAAGDICWLKIDRDPGVTDDATGDAELLSVVLEYVRA